METTTTPRTRKTILGTVVAGIIASAITVPTLTASGATPAPVTETVTVERVAEPTPSATEQDIIDWAFDLFAEAGLELPALEIGFYDTKEPCEGNKGTYRPQADGIAKVRICDWHERETLRDAWRRKTLVHELAHAWAHENLTTDHAETFTVHRGLTAWTAPEVAWEQRATEHAAEIITWGIIDQPMRIDTRITGTTTPELVEAYTLLTGQAPTNGPTING